jgi:hypothetical protein
VRPRSWNQRRAGASRISSQLAPQSCEVGVAQRAPRAGIADQVRQRVLDGADGAEKSPARPARRDRRAGRQGGGYGIAASGLLCERVATRTAMIDGRRAIWPRDRHRARSGNPREARRRRGDPNRRRLHRPGRESRQDPLPQPHRAGNSSSAPARTAPRRSSRCCRRPTTFPTHPSRRRSNASISCALRACCAEHRGPRRWRASLDRRDRFAL